MIIIILLVYQHMFWYIDTISTLCFKPASSVTTLRPPISCVHGRPDRLLFTAHHIIVDVSFSNYVSFIMAAVSFIMAAASFIMVAASFIMAAAS